MSQAIAYTYKTATNHLNYINAFLFIAIFALVGVYAFGLFSTISLNFSIRETESNIVKISASIGKLESQYMEFAKKTTINNLSDYDLHQAQISAYIDTNVRLGMSSPDLSR